MGPARNALIEWSPALRKKKKLDKRPSNTTIVFLSDLHAPFIDDKAYLLAKKIMVDVSPDIVCLGGDIIDFYAVSNWTVDVSRANVLSELNSVLDILKELRDLFPRAKFYYIQGNHELRMQTYVLRKADRLAPLIGYNLSIIRLLQLEELHIEYVTSPLKIGKLYLLHGHERKSRGQLVHVALNMLRYFKRNILFGHFHKFDVFYDTELEGTINGSYLNGCLFDMSKMPTPYEMVDTSQKGISVVNLYNGYFTIEQMIFHKKSGGYICYGHNYCYE